MMTMGLTSPTCLLAISSHGLGHLAQACPIAKASSRLAAQLNLPSIKWIVRTTIKPELVFRRLPNDGVQIDHGADDFGMVMHDAMTIDLAASLQQYAELHANWDERVETLANHLTNLNVDAVLADVPYLTLAAAAHVSIPSLAFCSLNWADILLPCVEQHPEALEVAGISSTQFDTIISQIQDAYRSASLFLCPTPSMPMPSLGNTLQIGPVCEEFDNHNSRQVLEDWAAGFGLKADCLFVVVSMGGIPTALDMQHWPTTCHGRPICYIPAGNHPSLKLPPNALSFAHWKFGYQKLLAGCDLVISKPGYGTFVEAAVLGKPLIYFERPLWPEADALSKWIDSRGHAVSISAQACDLAQEIEAAMAELLSRKEAPKLHPTGNDEAARHVLQLLFESSPA